MEKLYVRLVLLLVVLSSSKLHSQNEFGVFKVSGSPRIVDAGNLKKGDIINKGDAISLLVKDEVILLDAQGQLYKISGVTAVKYNEIQNFNTELEAGSFSKKYLTYVWNRFTKKSGKNDNISVVYRNDYLYLQLAPSDSIKIFRPEINFSWTVKNPNETKFFILKENGSSHITKLGIQGNTLHLSVDNELLKVGKQYGWAISESQFPDMNELKMHNFFILSAAEFKAMKPAIDSIKKDFIALGFSEIEIKEIFCFDFKICY